MSLTLDRICDRFPNWVSSINPKVLCVHNSSGFPIGYIHQDRTRCIYDAVLQDWGINMKFLSNFKYKKLLSTNLWGNRLNLFVLQEMLDE